jgi:hypothetical protein
MSTFVSSEVPWRLFETPVLSYVEGALRAPKDERGGASGQVFIGANRRRSRW